MRRSAASAATRQAAPRSSEGPYGPPWTPLVVGRHAVVSSFFYTLRDDGMFGLSLVPFYFRENVLEPRAVADKFKRKCSRPENCCKQIEQDLVHQNKSVRALSAKIY